MTDQPKRDAGPWLGCLIAAIVLGLPLYVLSVGPYVWLHDNGYLSDAVGIIYYPLGLVIQSIPAVKQAVLWYLKFWRSP